MVDAETGDAKSDYRTMSELVRIYPSIKQKYILVRAGWDGRVAVLLWGNPNIEWHNDILGEMVNAGIEVMEVLGGGWLFVNPEEGSVHVWGKSDRFGPPPMQLVRELLGEDLIESEPA